LGYFWTSFYTLLGGNFHGNLAGNPTGWVAAAVVRPGRGHCNLGRPVTVTPGYGGPTWLPRCRLTSFILRLLSARGR